MPEILINDQIYTDGDIEVLIGKCDAYRNKALELACKVFNEYGECPGECSWCHLGDKTLNKCDKVIYDVDGCIND